MDVPRFIQVSRLIDREGDRFRSTILPVDQITAITINEDYETVIDCAGKTYRVDEAWEHFANVLQAFDVLELGMPANGNRSSRVAPTR